MSAPPSHPEPASPVHLFTIGFTKRTAADFFGTLRQAGIQRLLDVRLNNSSQLAGFTKAEWQTLKTLLQRMLLNAGLCRGARCAAEDAPETATAAR